MLASTIALNRFGLGGAPGDKLFADPKRWLLGQLETFEPRPESMAQVPACGRVIGQLADYAAASPKAKLSGQSPSLNTARVAQTASQANRRKALSATIQQDYLLMNAARLSSALTTDTPFIERLVHFWANHFAVSVTNLQVRGLAGLLEIEAIRPHVLGNFSDMLLAVEQHPAMLIYLDQAQSVGPTSHIGLVAARRGGKKAGLNENLARETLELHTLGVRNGYSQSDVTEFARALTGWTVRGLRHAAGSSGHAAAGCSQFVGARHEPGERLVLGRRYAQPGEAQARAILLDLAANAATAKHLATKLARHFAGDAPPAALVARLGEALRSGNGELKPVYRALIESPETWVAAPLKFKTPWEWLVSAFRAVGIRTLDPGPAAGMLKQLGQPTWQPGSPAGWDDTASAWAAPDALMRRVQVARRIAGKTEPAIDPRALAQTLFPGSLTDSTRIQIAQAESLTDGLVLLLVSPEFMRR